MLTKHLEVKFTLADKSWTLDFASLTVDEYIAAKRVTGYRIPEWLAEYDRFCPLAIKAVVWLARRRTGENLQWDDPEMSFLVSDLRIETVRDTTAVEDAPDNGQEAAGAVPTKAPKAAPRTRTSKSK